MKGKFKPDAGQRYSLDAIQGTCWSNCDDPAAAFLINGNEYSGDFAGQYALTLADDIIVLQDGLADGHSLPTNHAGRRGK